MQVPRDSKIYIINRPISARYGIPTMYDMLLTDALHIGWNGFDPIVVATLNEKKTICKVFVVDGSGYSCTTRRLAKGRFKFTFSNTQIPTFVGKKLLERFITTGSLK